MDRHFETDNPDKFWYYNLRYGTECHCRKDLIHAIGVLLKKDKCINKDK